LKKKLGLYQAFFVYYSVREMKKEKKKTKNQNPPSMVVSPRWGVAKVCETITAEVTNQNKKEY
jgi:hypothetical protein